MADRIYKVGTTADTIALWERLERRIKWAEEHPREDGWDSDLPISDRLEKCREEWELKHELPMLFAALQVGQCQPPPPWLVQALTDNLMAQARASKKPKLWAGKNEPRHLLVKHLMDNPNSWLWGNTTAGTWDPAFERASKLFKGTEFAGTATAMEESYKVFKRKARLRKPTRRQRQYAGQSRKPAAI